MILYIDLVVDDDAAAAALGATLRLLAPQPA
jgi:hypothetical protein